MQPSETPQGIPPPEERQAVVLVVDDEVGPRESLRLILSPEFTVEIAEDGNQAVAAFDRVAPDVILSDIRMPKMDGVTLMKAIRERSADVPFILITGYASLDSAKEAVRAGAFDYISKPYNVSDIRDVVRRALKSRRQSRDKEQMVQRLVHANHELEDRIRDLDQRASVGDLSAEVIHDLNNPICALQGYVELLEHSMDQQAAHDDSEERELVDTIKRQARRCIELTRNFLNYARPNRAATREAIDINNVLDETLMLFQARFRHLDIQLETELDEDLPHTTAEPVSLQQVFYNLIANACQAMESHQRRPHILRVATRTTSGNDGGRTVTATIADNGPGIPREIQDKVFERFFTTKSRDEGTGLGLAISNRIVSDHDGALTFQSTPGEGASFTITLPAHDRG